MTLSIARYGHGHPVVFLPPALLSGDYYAEVLARAPEGFETWLVDLPDHERDEPEYDLAAMLDAVGAALDAVPRPFTLVGSSLGGYLAVHLAPRMGARLQRVVVVGGLGTMPAEMAAAYRRLADEVEAETVPAAAAKVAAIEAAGGPRLSAADRSKLVDRSSSWPTERFVRCLRRVRSWRITPRRSPSRSAGSSSTRATTGRFRSISVGPSRRSFHAPSDVSSTTVDTSSP